MTNTFKYRAYYHYNGPSHADPFRSQKNTQQVASALADFPGALRHLLTDPQAVVTPASPQPNPSSSHVSVTTVLDEAQTDAAVAKCLNSLDLYGEKLATLELVRPNPSLHLTRYSRLRRLPHAGELQR